MTYHLNQALEVYLNEQERRYLQEQWKIREIGEGREAVGQLHCQTDLNGFCF
jgi:hypothetical protein